MTAEAGDFDFTRGWRGLGKGRLDLPITPRMGSLCVKRLRQLEIRGRDHDDQEQTEGVGHDVPFAAWHLLPTVVAA